MKAWSPIFESTSEEGWKHLGVTMASPYEVLTEAVARSRNPRFHNCDQFRQDRTFINDQMITQRKLLYIIGKEEYLDAYPKCYADLFINRTIAYLKKQRKKRRT
jgi:phosphoenolpyruvate synthase/pyruvate phosphate dikinase